MSPGPQVTVKLFGAYRDAVGAESLVCPLPAGLRLGALWAQLCADWPELAPLASARLSAVNLDYAADDRVLADGDEVAFFPPVSGG